MSPARPARPATRRRAPTRLELEIPARAEFIGLARLVVSAAAATQPCFGEERLDELRIAVSEACSNAIHAHQSAHREDRILVRCQLDGQRCEVQVIDRGLGFDPDSLEVLPPMSDPRRLEHESGLGISLMRQMADETEIRSTPEGTEVRLVVYPRPVLAG